MVFNAIWRVPMLALRHRRSIAAVGLVGWASAIILPAQAQEVVAPPPATPLAEGQATAITSARKIPALTPVEIEIDAALSSRSNKPGDMFPLHLAKAIEVDGHVVVPAGAVGQGEVIHAKKAGMSGSAGALILAARFIDFGGQHLRLRSMQMVRRGNSNEGAVIVTGALLGPIALLVTGTNSDVAIGSQASAKTAEDFTLPNSAPRK